MRIHNRKITGVIFVVLILAVVYGWSSAVDDRILSEARETYVFKNYLKDDAIEVYAKDGAVTLTGSVNDPGHKSLAQETIQNLPGVKSVYNQLTVNGKQPSENSDAWLTMKAKAALLFHRNVSAVTTKIDVKEAIATLEGVAESLAQKELTEEYVKDVDGIKAVRNEMTVQKSGKSFLSNKIDDASITAQVKIALLSHHSTSAVRTNVETRNGIVTVSGAAKTEAEKDLVTKLVMDIHGVVGVHNDIVTQL